MMKKSVVAAAMLMALSTSIQVQADDTNTNTTNQGRGNITFTGSIVDAPCSIKPGNDDQTVDMGQIGKYSLLANEGVPRDFSIALEGCDVSKFDSLDVTFTGTLDDDAKPDVLGIKGTAKGAGIKIKSLSSPVDKQEVTFGVATPVSGLVNGTGPQNVLKFQASMISTVADEKDIVEGDFAAQANFMLEYK